MVHIKDLKIGGIYKETDDKNHFFIIKIDDVDTSEEDNIRLQITDLYTPDSDGELASADWFYDYDLAGLVYEELPKKSVEELQEIHPEFFI